MKFQLSKLKFPMHLKMTVFLFTGIRSFVEHLQKHFISPPESTYWQRLINFDQSHWKKLLKKKYQRISADDLIAEGTEALELLQHAYDDIASYILQQGVKHADDTPKYIKIQYYEEDLLKGDKKKTKNCICLSEHGCLIIIRGNAVRTAYFPGASAKSQSFYDWYNRGLERLHHAARDVEQKRIRYKEDERIRMTPISVEWYTRETLASKNNPWNPPKDRKKKPKPPRDDYDDTRLERYIKKKYT